MPLSPTSFHSASSNLLVPPGLSWWAALTRVACKIHPGDRVFLDGNDSWFAVDAAPAAAKHTHTHARTPTNTASKLPGLNLGRAQRTMTDSVMSAMYRVRRVLPPTLERFLAPAQKRPAA